MKKRVMHIINNFKIGGAEKLLLYFFQNVSSRDFDFIIASLSGEGELKNQLNALDFPVYSFSHTGGTSIKLILKLVKFLSNQKIDIVHTHNLGPHFYAGWAVWILRKFTGQKITHIHTQHGLVPDFSSREKLKHSFVNHSDNIFIAVSDEVHNFLTDKWGIKQNVITIPNGIKINDKIIINKDKLKEELGFPADSVIVGTVGRLAPVKDHGTLLKAFSLLKKDIPNSYLIIAGDGPERTSLERHVNTLNLKNHVIFLGMVNDVSKYLSIMDMFVLSSLSEGTSVALLEAMSMGVPPLCTKVGGNVNIITQGENGFLFDTGDFNKLGELLIKLAKDKRLSEQISENARNSIRERYSIEKMIEKYLELYTGTNNV